MIVRVRDEAPALRRCLELVRAQSVAAELIVVDNASGDGSASVAAAAGARVVSISRSEFSFGRALNRGAAVAGGPVLVALSAHAFVRDPHWLERLLAWFQDPTVACACGERFRPDGTVLLGPARIGRAEVERLPDWGFSNAAGGFRADLWRRRGFREDLPACEDKEWGRWVAREAGGITVLDPALVVDHDHTHDPVGEIYRRARREAAGYRGFLDPEQVPGPASPAELLSGWWSDTRFYTSSWRARLSHRRAAALLGAYAGRRGGAQAAGH